MKKIIKIGCILFCILTSCVSCVGSPLQGLQLKDSLLEKKENLGIKEISSTYTHSVAVRDNGIIFPVVGYDFDGELDFDQWENIKDIYVDSNGTYGVTAEGKVFYTGYDGDYQRQMISSWENIVSLESVPWNYIAGIKDDGTVVISDEEIQKYVENWTDIVSIAAHDYYIVGLKKNGTVVITDTFCTDEQLITDDVKEQVKKWKDIVQIDTIYGLIVGLTKDGIIKTLDYGYIYGIDDEGYGCGYIDIPSLERWTDIVSFSFTGMNVVGITTDGTLRTTGRIMATGHEINGYFSLDEMDSVMTNVIDASVSGNMLTIVFDDGTIRCAGYDVIDYDYHQYNLYGNALCKEEYISDTSKFQGCWEPEIIKNGFPDYMYLFGDGTGECDHVGITWSAENHMFRLSTSAGFGQSEVFNYEIYGGVLYIENQAGERMRYYKVD